MLQRCVIVLSVIGDGDRAVQRRLKLARKVRLSSQNSFGGWRRRWGDFIAGSRRLRANCSAQRVPIGNAKRLGDQFEAFADGDLESLGGEHRTQRTCHSFGIAEVAHVLILCLNETGVPGLALLTRRSGKGYESRDTFTIPEGRKRQVVSTSQTHGLTRAHCQSPVA